MNVAIYIARKLSLKSERRGRISPGVATAVIGVALALAIMILSIAVIRGFKKEITGKITGFSAPITLYAPMDSETPSLTSGIHLTDTLQTIIAEAAPDSRADLIIRQPAIFKTDSDFQGIILKGLPQGEAWKFYGENLTEGALPSDTAEAYPNQVVISARTAAALGLRTGDRVPTHFLSDNSLRTRGLTVSGIFDSHFSDFDQTVALTPLAMLQRLNRVDSITGTSVEIRNLPLEAIEPTLITISDLAIQSTIKNPDNPLIFRAESVTQTNHQYFSWLDLLDTNVAVIIILMACVAGFTLISSLFILILERVNTIGLLKALGSSNRLVRSIFIYMALRLVLAGMIAGNLLSLLLIWVQDRYRVMGLDPEAYYINFVPVDISVSDILIVNISAIVIAALVLILPSHLIATLSPARTLRFE